MKKRTHRITHPHDRFFKAAMANKQVAKEFFEAELPVDLLPHIDLNNLEMQSGSYVDDTRKESTADILYKTKIAGHEAYLFLIVDHQSTPDPLMPFRMLRYTCNIITQYLRDHKAAKTIPFVLPLVVYHGKTKWSYSLAINDLVDAPKDLVEAHFLKHFALLDLARIEDEALKQKAWFGVMALTLKHIFNPDMTPHLVDIIKLFKVIDEAGDQSLIEITMRYILDRGGLFDKMTFLETVQAELSFETGEKLMTMAEYLRQEGRELVAKHMLAEGLDLEYIARLTELPIDRLKILQDQDKH